MATTHTRSAEDITAPLCMEQPRAPVAPKKTHALPPNPIITKKVEKKRLKHQVIDLCDTDGDTDGEEAGPDEYEDDGFVVRHDAARPEDDEGPRHPLSMLDTDDMEASADRLWINMLRRQAQTWAHRGRDTRTKRELEYKLTQFRTPDGFGLAAALAAQYDFAYRRPRVVAFKELKSKQL